MGLPSVDERQALLTRLPPYRIAGNNAGTGGLCGHNKHRAGTGDEKSQSLQQKLLEEGVSFLHSKRAGDCDDPLTSDGCC